MWIGETWKCVCEAVNVLRKKCRIFLVSQEESAEPVNREGGSE